MDVLVIGSGGREHALAWKIAQSPQAERVFVAPGNAGTAEDAENVDLPLNDFGQIIQFAKQNAIELIVVGPEAPLAAGIVEWGDDDIRAVYESLPTREPTDYHYSSIRPLKYVFKEIVADYVYDGVLKVVREEK